METSVDNENSIPIVSDIQKREEGLLSFLGGFAGLSSMMFAVLLLLFASPVSDGTIDVLGFRVSYLILLAFYAFVSLLVLKWKCLFFSSSRGKSAIVLASLIGTCICPLLMGLDLTGLAIPLLAVGLVCTSFRWCLRLCEYSRILLVPLISIAFACAIVITGFVSIMSLSNLEISILICGFSFFSWILLWINKEKIHEELMSVSSAESRKRAVTASADRWTYATIGLDFGFVLGLICTQRDNFLTINTLENLTPMVIFVLPILTASIALLIFHRKRDYALERYSKDHLALTIALGALPLSFLQNGGQYLCLLFLLFVVSIQVIIVINASIEFIRFEQLNPAWYMGEEAFVGAGIVLGLICASVGVFQAGLSSPLLPMACILVVLLNVFAQTFINRGNYPTSDLFDTTVLGNGSVPPSIPPSGQDLALESAKIPTEKKESLPPSKDSLGNGGSWRFKIAYVCKKYDLSPRQTEIFELLAKGRDARFIEETFCISKATTKTHMRHR